MFIAFLCGWNSHSVISFKLPMGVAQRYSMPCSFSAMFFPSSLIRRLRRHLPPEGEGFNFIPQRLALYFLPSPSGGRWHEVPDEGSKTVILHYLPAVYAWLIIYNKRRFYSQSRFSVPCTFNQHHAGLLVHIGMHHSDPLRFYPILLHA